MAEFSGSCWGHGLYFTALLSEATPQKGPIYFIFHFRTKNSFLLEWGWKILQNFAGFQSVMSHSLRPQGLQHVRLLCLSLSPRVCSNSCPLGQWCHTTISSSALFSFPQSFQSSGSFSMSQFFTSGGQIIGASVSASALAMNIQGSLGLTGLISLQSKRLSSFLQYHNPKASILWHSAFFKVQLLCRIEYALNGIIV